MFDFSMQLLFLAVYILVACVSIPLPPDIKHFLSGCFFCCILWHDCFIAPSNPRYNHLFDSLGAILRMYHDHIATNIQLYRNYDQLGTHSCSHFITLQTRDTYQWGHMWKTYYRRPTDKLIRSEYSRSLCPVLLVVAIEESLLILSPNWGENHGKMLFFFADIKNQPYIISKCIILYVSVV